MADAFSQKGDEGVIVDDAPALNEGLLYFGNRLCPFAHRAWWAMEELGVSSQYTYYHIELGPSKPAWYGAKVNPFATVPAVYDNGKPVLESLIVAEYLSEKFGTPETALLPHDPVERATIRLLTARWGDKCTRPLYSLLSNTDPSKADELEDAARAALVAFNEEVERFGSHDTDYLVGNRLTLADIAIVPFLERFSASLLHWREFELLPDDGKHDRLRRLLAASRARPAFQKTTVSADFFAWAYRDYAKEITPGRARRHASATL